MEDVLALSFQRGANYVFFTDDILPNPWDSLPKYYFAEVTRASLNCGNCNRNITTVALQWVQQQQNGDSGLVVSFEAPSTATWAASTAYSYDQAVAAIGAMLYAVDALSMGSETAKALSGSSLAFAESVLDAVQSRLVDLRSGPMEPYLYGVPQSWDAGTGERSTAPVRSGSAAWVAEAFALYGLLTGNTTRYRSGVIGICNWLKQRLVASGSTLCVAGGSDVSWCSTEHNIDSYFAFDLATAVTDDESFAASAAAIKDSALLTSLWNDLENRFNQGYEDPYMALDANSWGAVWLQSHANSTATTVNNSRTSSTLAFIETRFSAVQSSVLSESKATGYGPYADESNSFHAKTVWGEGSLGVALAFLRNGNYNKFRTIVGNLVSTGFDRRNSTMLSAKGAILYAANLSVVNTAGDVFYPYASVASTGWLAIVCSPSEHLFWNAQSGTYAGAKGILSGAMSSHRPTAKPSLAPSAQKKTRKPVGVFKTPKPSIKQSRPSRDRSDKPRK
jgi:hypothetical protein